MRSLLLISVFLLSALTGCAALPSQTAAARANWERQQGGTLAPESAPLPAHRAMVALQRLTDSSTPLTIHLLNTTEPVAYSFSDGAIYLSIALVNELNDDQLCGAIAHEMGHLLRDGILRTPEALRGVDNNMDIEHAADLLGRQLMQSRGIPTTALTQALQRVANDSRGTPYYPALIDRVHHLQSLDAR